MNETTQPAIVQTLRGKIFPGEASPGRRLAEARLAQWLGMPHTPLRHARTI
ncbi:GntR family transcriptional regulator [Burkholderia sp. Ax-1724]|uniref:GntR family transcriptional regulator n=1 Tax=Burkholderia sp. Ax-1724 TaxID=2608336 RepID=UPI00142218CA|nr:GntR family transcriptional regulator [Burkholderia sp. Ax-1724]NIF53972.1 GntR family transcriptional regulator [Burkholderia sp. Ax-1724]